MPLRNKDSSREVRGAIVIKAGLSPQDAIRYVLSLPICTLVSGIDSESVLDQNLEILRRITP